MAPRNVAITAVDGNTGHSIAELLLTDETFSTKIDSITGITLHPSAAKSKELAKLGVSIVAHKHGRERDMVKLLKDSGADTICLIPPTHAEKFDITVELLGVS
ncbi:hypothetical protein CLAFUW4_01690 [Fulvia fulva]|uniref:NmrA-like domain-containing protein n=1 Tax=Passalora fulva TaxID=5499 RepID=A0A9Q8L5U1_PASFU|nr:uncharacterized protein CLAFUR5_01688 [Fulvia fulva]KAK4636003.1 hypothetical protein CLAFUR4_01688 [Fulvia fulva]KAK4636828.1 hypothetical protein CLAFUR0_01689 [Fulvia fulva]UJO11373.1 hypothetical protein CLAFUR5_01688 [Fulvia fulva]WPV09708.1 hypothetical protein CLAFUW4_01690 [Fulvia fulva]WPV25171.1 hypothetical protein CLAFUW7_01692 [Fulvia fulva]